MPGVLKDSVDANFAARSLRMSFRAQPPTAKEGAHASHALQLNLAGGIDPAGCRYDAADNNMMVVLKKASEGEEWPALKVSGASEAVSVSDAPPTNPPAAATAAAPAAPSQPASGGKQQLDKLLFELD